MINPVVYSHLDTVKSPLSGPLTNRHLLLPGTIFGHTKIISCSWSAVHAGQGWVTCINSVFSMQPHCKVGGTGMAGKAMAIPVLEREKKMVSLEFKFTCAYSPPVFIVAPDAKE